MKVSKLRRLTIFGVEQTFKNKFWIILNVLMLIAAIAYVNFGTVKEIIESRKEASDKDNINLMIIDETDSFENKILNFKNDKIVIKEYSESGVEDGNILVEISYDNENYIHARITSSEYIDMTYYSLFETAINEIRDEVFANRNNLSIEEVKKASNNVEIERIITTLDKELYDKYSGILLGASLVVYMLFIFISSSLASTIGMEKVSRTTEYMLTGISENAYLWYNILQTNIVVLLQGALSVIYIVIATLINSVLRVSFLGAEISLDVGLNVSLNIEPTVLIAAVVLLVQAIIAVLILSIIQAVLSSRVNNISDVSNSTVLVLFFVIFATVIFPNFIPTAEKVNIFLKIISMIPVISAVAVPKLYLLGQISTFGAILSVIISIAITAVLTVFGSKAFKKGLLSLSKGSKKEERVEKAALDDFNASKFRASISKVSMALIIYLVFSNILGIITKFAFASLGGVLNYIVQIVTWIVSIYPSYWYLKNSNYTRKIESGKVKIDVKKIAILIVIAFGIIWAVQLVSEYISKDLTNIIELINLDMNTPLECILFVVYIALLPAIFEELLFRKAIFGVLKKYGIKLAIIISSVAFGLMHQNFSQGIFACLVGVVFCIIDDKAGTILPSMILHFINNCVAAVQVIMMNKMGEEAENIFDVIGIIFNVWAVISLVVVILQVIKNRKNKESIEKMKVSNEKEKIEEIKESQKEEIKKENASNVNSVISIKNPVKVICSDFVTDLTVVIYVIITVCVSKLI
ncbi:MAG: CPBP family intramembrane metalloprotease [Clostridia bacterium]|nr:CPBP family intramembrane metalloprotease [Clostridia bacterium]